MSRFVSLFLAVSLLAACGPTTYVVQGRSPFIGVDGTVKIESQDGANVVLVELDNLVPPARVQDGLTQYVMWIANSGAPPMRVATVLFDEADREGRSRATTADARFTVIVSAEGNGVPNVPSEHVVFQQVVEID